MVWENSPSHICRGGDVRGLAFCCPPVKPCPIMGPYYGGFKGSWINSSRILRH